MLLNQTDIYALRSMTYLALLPEGELVSSNTMAEATNIPSHYINKVMRRLVEAGLVLSRKGHHGGFQLAKEPGEITLMDILLVMKEPGFDKICAFGWGSCSGEHPCPLHNTWQTLKDSFHEWADNTTLADVRHSSIPSFLTPPEEVPA